MVTNSAANKSIPVIQDPIATERKKLRVLLLAEPCNPKWSSVPLVGYNIVKSLAQRPDLDVTLATHIRNKPGLDGDPLLDLAKVCYIDNDWLAAPAFHLSRLLRGGTNSAWSVNTAMAWPSYVAFEWHVYRRFGKEITNHHFDLIHRITPVSPVISSPLVCWTKIPMIIGPLNGGLPWPKEFDDLRRREREWLLPFRKFSRFLPYFGAMYRKAAAIIYASQHTGKEIPSGNGPRFWVPENGVDPARFLLASGWCPPQGPFRFVSVGRFAAGKCFDLVIEAISRSEILRKCRLSLIGDGEEKTKLQNLVEEKELTGVVEFPGWLDQSALSALLRSSQVFVFPSIKEFGGGVVMEAMSAGLPCIVSDYGGPGETVNSDSGYKLKITNREGLTQRLQEVMEELVKNPEKCETMGKVAIQRVQKEFLWSAKAEKLVEIYRQILPTVKS